jgi:parallel beta-helix repeat protein
MNKKIDEISAENDELKERLAQQQLKEEQAVETGPTEEKIWHYINLFPDGSGDFSTIEEALEKIQPGGTINLNPGTYYPDSNLKISKPLYIIGSGMDITYIIYNKEPNIIEYTGTGLLKISQISLQREGLEWGDVIWIKSGSISISDCSISGATHFEKEEEGQVGGGMGILIWGDTKGIIENCTIENNSVDGIHIRNQSFINIINNNIGKNEQYGISYWDETQGIVLNNECHDNDSGIGIRNQSIPKILANICENNSYAGIDYYGEMSGIAFQNICFENGHHGISVGLNSEPKLIENICRDNIEVGIVFYEESKGFIGFNECYRNEYGIYIEKDADPILGENNFIDNTNNIMDNR